MNTMKIKCFIKSLIEMHDQNGVVEYRYTRSALEYPDASPGPWDWTSPEPISGLLMGSFTGDKSHSLAPVVYSMIIIALLTKYSML